MLWSINASWQLVSLSATVGGIISIIERLRRSMERIWAKGQRIRLSEMVALLPLDYLLTAFQTHHPTSATSTHGTSARKTISTSSTTKAETAVRLVSAFASSVMKRQRGIRDIGSGIGESGNTC